MAQLNTEPNIADPDGFYEALIGAHETLDEDQSAALNARLILILANQIGDTGLLKQAIAAAAAPGAAGQPTRAGDAA